jgi:hypothetical protein
MPRPLQEKATRCSSLHLLADDAGEAVREDPAAQVRLQLLVNVTWQPTTMRVRRGERLAEAIQLGGDDLVEERLFGLVAAVLGHRAPPLLHALCPNGPAGDREVALAPASTSSNARTASNRRTPKRGLLAVGYEQMLRDFALVQRFSPRWCSTRRSEEPGDQEGNGPGMNDGSQDQVSAARAVDVSRNSRREVSGRGTKPKDR